MTYDTGRCMDGDERWEHRFHTLPVELGTTYYTVLQYCCCTGYDTQYVVVPDATVQALTQTTPSPPGRVKNWGEGGLSEVINTAFHT